MSRNYVQSDLDNREMTNVMPAWKALKVFWKRSSKSTCTLEMEGKKIPNRDSEKTVKYEIRENRALERAGSFYINWDLFKGAL